MKKLLNISYFLFTFTVLMGHPHVFFENDFNLLITSKETKITLHLILDEMNTILVKENNNSNELYKNIFHDLKVCYNDNLLENNMIDESIDISGENIILNITFSYPITLKENDKLLISIYDEEYFYDYDYNKYSLNITNEVDLLTNIKFLENKKKAYYYDMVYPKEYEVLIYEKSKE